MTAAVPPRARKESGEGGCARAETTSERYSDRTGQNRTGSRDHRTYAWHRLLSPYIFYLLSRRARLPASRTIHRRIYLSEA